MNDDEIEKKLRALTGARHRPDPTPAWKDDILARARREAEAIPLPRTLPPRWLMLSWAAAWIAILFLNFATPGETATATAGSFASTEGGSATAIGQSDLASPQTLLAFERKMDPNLDLPR